MAEKDDIARVTVTVPNTSVEDIRFSMYHLLLDTRAYTLRNPMRVDILQALALEICHKNHADDSGMGLSATLCADESWELNRPSAVKCRRGFFSSWRCLELFVRCGFLAVIAMRSEESILVVGFVIVVVVKRIVDLGYHEIVHDDHLGPSTDANADDGGALQALARSEGCAEIGRLIAELVLSQCISVEVP